MIIAGRREQLLAEITAEHEGMDFVVLDVGEPDSIRRCFATVTAKYPQLNVVINNAGIMLAEDLTDPGHLSVAEETVTTNLLGPIRLLAEFVPFLTAQPGDATIINVSSGLAGVCGSHRTVTQEGRMSPDEEGSKCRNIASSLRSTAKKR